MNEKIITLLRSEPGYCSGERMSQALGISRTAVWKHMAQLKKDGYCIEAVSRRGYRLVSSPDKLLPREVQKTLRTKTFGKKILYLETVGSTMDEARRLAFEQQAEGVVVCAEAQTKGRGRLGRMWVSEQAKGIYASIILRPKVAVAAISGVTLLFAVALCQALRKITGVPATIKWPNDILVNDKKIAGILTELNAEMDRVHFVIVGFGINISYDARKLPAGATSVYQETKKDFSRARLLATILEIAERDYDIFQKKGFAPIARKWRRLSSTLGRRVNVVEANKITHGRAVDIGLDGSLFIKMNNGTIVRKVSGDVVHLR